MEQGYELLPLTSPRYPPTLLDLGDPPPVLFLKGKGGLLFPPAVAVIGSRKATEGGRRVAQTIGRLLAEAGITVISGLALGIDGSAHRGALAGGGRTAGVVGSGLGVVYPASHRSLWARIEEEGVVVSELQPQERARAFHFPKRNRMIAALAQAVIVVEAGRKSGALITVDQALELGREVLVTPGSVENPQAVGSNMLLRDGARALVAPELVIEELAGLGVRGSSPGEGLSEASEPHPSVPAGLASLWAALSSDPRAIDEVAGKADLTVGEALAGLATMELEGWVQQCPGMRFKRG